MRPPEIGMRQRSIWLTANCKGMVAMIQQLRDWWFLLTGQENLERLRKDLEFFKERTQILASRNTTLQSDMRRQTALRDAARQELAKRKSAAPRIAELHLLKGDSILLHLCDDRLLLLPNASSHAPRWADITPMTLIPSEALSKNKPEDLCEDEGCPHHGTPHVCVDKMSEEPALDLLAELRALRKLMDDQWKLPRLENEDFYRGVKKAHDFIAKHIDALLARTGGEG